MATPLIREFPRGGELTKVKLSTSSTDLVQIPASVISSEQHLLYLKENQYSLLRAATSKTFLIAWIRFVLEMEAFVLKI